ncbi:hypothetical protein NN561_007200 [Cricetulus griseus]
MDGTSLKLPDDRAEAVFLPQMASWTGGAQLRLSPVAHPEAKRLNPVNASPRCTELPQWQPTFPPDSLTGPSHPETSKNWQGSELGEEQVGGSSVHSTAGMLIRTGGGACTAARQPPALNL